MLHLKPTSKLLSIVLLYSVITGAMAQNRLTLSGSIREASSKELLMGVSLYIPALKQGTVTNSYGFYTITLPPASYEIVVSYVGFQPKAFEIVLDQNKEFDIELEALLLDEVVITSSQATRQAEQIQMSAIEIPVQQIKDIPALFGEKDVLKVIQLLPGVQKAGEGTSGLYVRGGGPDQNLIILDEAVVYNAFHLFGFFSVFNGDALKNITLTKGGFPARYGGRLSSVLDMNMKEGDMQKTKGEAGIGIISSRFLVEGPIKPNKSSFLISGRRTYIDALTRPFMSSRSNGGYYFYDFNAKFNYILNNKNRLYLSGYFGRDRFSFKQNLDASNQFESAVGWGNMTGTLRWNTLINPRLFANTSLIISDYTFAIRDESMFQGSKYQLRYSSGIRDLSLKHDWDYRPSPMHSIRAGVIITHHQFTPSAVVFRDDFTNSSTRSRVSVPAIESAAYIEDELSISEKLRVLPGIRLSHFSGGKNHYINPEPRLSTRYLLKPDLSLKASYAQMNQYVHLLTNTGVGLPTDLWVPSSDFVKPQESHQLAAGVAKDILNKDLAVSLEGYYKESQRVIAYKEGASFLEIDNSRGVSGYSWEKNITSGRGWSYGMEVMIQKKVGRLSGWIGYTLSWTQLQFDELNFGKKFWARHDRRHDASVVAIWKIREHTETRSGLTLSSTWVYGTGNAITLPVAEYVAPIHDPGSGPLTNLSGIVNQYTGRNQFRMAAYHRMDLGFQITRQKKWWVRTWEFSVYNLYNRYNPFFYFIDNSGDGKRVLKQVTLFPLLPSVSYNIKF